jgi:hypothetical protein
MIIDVNAILIVEKKKNNNKLAITTSKEITKVSLAQEGNLDEVVEASNILNEIGGKNVEIPNEVMAKPLIPIVEEINTQLIEEEGMLNAPTYVDMEKEKVHAIVSEEVISGGKDDQLQYLKDEDVEITTVEEPFHQKVSHGEGWF